MVGGRSGDLGAGSVDYPSLCSNVPLSYRRPMPVHITLSEDMTA